MSDHTRRGPAGVPAIGVRRSVPQGAMDAEMTEAQLLAGLTDALTIAGWIWTHIRRSDGVTMGYAGLPDIVAVHPTRHAMIMWELKGPHGVVALAQWQWIAAAQGIAGIDARIVRPGNYDELLLYIVGR